MLKCVLRQMELHLRAAGCHLPYGITVLQTQVDTRTRLNHSQKGFWPVLDLHAHVPACP